MARVIFIFAGATVITAAVVIPLFFPSLTHHQKGVIIGVVLSVVNFEAWFHLIRANVDAASIKSDHTLGKKTVKFLTVKLLIIAIAILLVLTSRKGEIMAMVGGLTAFLFTGMALIVIVHLLPERTFARLGASVRNRTHSS